MDITVNYASVLVAAASGMVVTSLWYTPRLFGNAWMRLTNTKPSSTATKRQLTLLYIGSLAAMLITAYVLAHVIYVFHRFMGGSLLVNALETSIFLWLGLLASRLWMQDTFERRPRKLLLFNLGSSLACLLTMGLVIGLIGF